MEVLEPLAILDGMEILDEWVSKDNPEDQELKVIIQII